jgi:hypothetical protein
MRPKARNVSSTGSPVEDPVAANEPRLTDTPRTLVAGRVTVSPSTVVVVVVSGVVVVVGVVESVVVVVVVGVVVVFEQVACAGLPLPMPLFLLLHS